MNNKLTKYPAGSVRELLAISFPLMLSILSTTLMILVDRIILAHYSLNAMNAVGTVANIMNIFICSCAATAAIAEIFVGRYNGKKEYSKMAIPVWQMLWFSFMSALVLIPCAFWSGKYLMPENIYDDGNPFYFWMMFFGWIFSVVAALSAFFIGQGKTLLVTIAACIANFTNIALDYLLIFGIEGYLEPLASAGAGIATVTSQFIFASILAVKFFSKENQEKYKTLHYKFNKTVFWDCLKIGAPSTLSHVIQISGWALLANYIASYHEEELTAYTFGISFFLFFVFYIDALTKAIAAIISNNIGAGNFAGVKSVIKSASRVHLFFIVILLIPIWIYPDFIINIYYGHNVSIAAHILEDSKIILKALILLFLLEGFTGIFCGVLTAGKDTQFILLANTMATWFCTVIPSIIMLKYYYASVIYVYLYTFPFYGMSMCIMYIYRFKSNKWMK